MDINQSEQQYYISKMAYNVISPTHYSCNVIGSNKNNIHSVVPNIYNSSHIVNAKQLKSNDAKIAQGIAYNSYSSTINSSVNDNEDFKYLYEGTRTGNIQNKRIENINKCINKESDNSSDITAAPNRLTILVQEVLPAQIPDHNPLNFKHHKYISVKSLPGDLSSQHEQSNLSVLPLTPISKNDTITDVIDAVIAKATSNDPNDDIFRNVIKSQHDPSSLNLHCITPNTIFSSRFNPFTDFNESENNLPVNKRRNNHAIKSIPKRQKMSDPLYNDHKSYQRCQLSAPNFRNLVHEPRISNKCSILPPFGLVNRESSLVNLSQLKDNCVKYKRPPFALSQPHPRTTYHDRFILQNLNVAIPIGELLASQNLSNDLDNIVTSSPKNNDLDYLSIFTSDRVSSPTAYLQGPTLEMLHPIVRTQTPQLALFHCPNKDYLSTPESSLRIRKCASNSASDTSVIDSETGELITKSSKTIQSLFPFDNTESPHTKLADLFTSPLYSEKVYKSTALISAKQSLEDGSNDTSSLVVATEDCSKDTHRIFIGESPSADNNISVAVVYGFVAKNKQICKRLHLVLSDKITKKKASLQKCSSRQFSGTKYRRYHCLTSHSPFVATFARHSLISETTFIALARQIGNVHYRSHYADSRRCSLCHCRGDLEEANAGRLLCGARDRWIHINCAIWCQGVHVSDAGAILGVPRAVAASCTACSKPGAGVVCCDVNCKSRYHFVCACDRKCRFSLTDHSFLCPLHSGSISQLPSLRIDRSLHLSPDNKESAQIVAALNDRESRLRIGSLTILSLGHLQLKQIESRQFHTATQIYPIGYKSQRIYWSTRLPNQRSLYLCEVSLCDNNKLLFKITESNEDDDTANIVYQGRDCTATWREPLTKIAAMRRAVNLVRLFPEHLQGEDLFGLTEPWVVRAIESLPELSFSPLLVREYAFKFAASDLLQGLLLPVCVSGCARMESYVNYGERHTLSPTVIIDVTKTRVIGDRLQQLIDVRRHWRSNVWLSRSRGTQRLSLCAARTIERDDVVLEYVGELVRYEVAVSRANNRRGRVCGSFMVRLNHGTVIDGVSRVGNVARYIRHSGEPNCALEIVRMCDNKNTDIVAAVIIAVGQIEHGEELTCDYSKHS